MSQHKMRTLTPLSFDPCRSHSWDLDSVVDQLSWKRWRETFYDWVNVHDCNNGISGIHVKELPEQFSIH